MQVYIQPSNLRVFTDDEYREVCSRSCVQFLALIACEGRSSRPGRPFGRWNHHRREGREARPPVTCLSVSSQEVPAAKLIPDRTYMFFSHTIKAQPSNMGMLDTILQKARPARVFFAARADLALQNIRLIDYEKICDAKGTRLVRFGKFAGFAGMIDMLRILGERLLALGYSTPFLVR